MGLLDGLNGLMRGREGPRRQPFSKVGPELLVPANVFTPEFAEGVAQALNRTGVVDVTGFETE